MAYSARSAAEHVESVRRLRYPFLYLLLAPDIDQIIIDVRTAATAIHHHATVLHHIANLYPDLFARWVIPRGTVG